LSSRLAVALPSVALVVVACVQVALARTATLSPWKGGGFGMFASTDGLPFRAVRLFVSAPERSEEVLVPPSLDDLAARTATFPHDRALGRLARAVGDREARQGRAVDRVTVEVWRAAYTATLHAEWTKLTARTIAIDAAAAERPR